MSLKTYRPLDEYVQAFAEYAPQSGRIFYTKPFGRHALINDSVSIYQVSHFADMTAEYASFFSGDFGLLFTEFPADLWDVLIKKAVTGPAEDVIIELYKSWKLYWERQFSLFETIERYEASKSESYDHFQQLVKTLDKSFNDLVSAAADLDEVNLLPVIALTIRSLYASFDEFYRDCVRVMTSVFFDQIGNGEFFIRVGPDQIPMPEDEIFYIYTVDVDF